MFFEIRVSKDSPTAIINENFAEMKFHVDFVDYHNFLSSILIHQHLKDVNVNNLFDPESFTVYENSSFYSCAMCAGDFYSYIFSCYLFFDKAAEVIEFVNSFTSDKLLQYKFKFLLKDIIDHFSSDSSFSISAVEIKDIVMAFFPVIRRDDWLCQFD